MFHSLVVRARAVADRLGTEASAFSVEGNADAATYLSFFERLLTSFEGAVTSLDDLVDTESRELLGVAVGCIFANLTRLHHGLDFKAVTEPVEQKRAAELNAALWQEVEGFV